MRLWPVVVAPLLMTMVAACGGGSDSAGSSPSATSAPAATASSPAATTDACALTDAVKQQATDSHITKLQVIGGCTQVSIETTFTRADFQKAADICTAVAKVAYVGDVSSVSVNGPDGHELAAGIKGEPCIGEP